MSTRGAADLGRGRPAPEARGGIPSPVNQPGLAHLGRVWACVGVLERWLVCAWAYVLVLMGLAFSLILAGVSVSSMFGRWVNLLSFFTVQSARNAHSDLLLASVSFFLPR